MTQGVRKDTCGKSIWWKTCDEKWWTKGKDVTFTCQLGGVWDDGGAPGIRQGVHSSGLLLFKLSKWSQPFDCSGCSPDSSTHGLAHCHKLFLSTAHSWLYFVEWWVKGSRGVMWVMIRFNRRVSFVQRLDPSMLWSQNVDHYFPVLYVL